MWVRGTRTSRASLHAAKPLPSDVVYDGFLE